ncbi:DEKNAAC103455 [Brettanomyces naardenensis]|uniref:DEKNAAC103455 n=1 Tax=Brettanomyces naardenensis TaxID=13370 RepID=A0A448YNC5_BRENA|nr:DEKNAAC103455 [Brettanomyces naardenensis]
MKAWIGLYDDQINFNSMSNLIERPYDLKVTTDYLNFLSETLQHHELLTQNHHPSFYDTCFTTWDFQAYSLTIDELTYTAYLILRNPYESYCGNKNTANLLLAFLFFIRDNYRLGNPFHNFRHAVDVLQATNFFLTVLEAHKSEWSIQFSAPERFALLLAALGHDLGHPATTNQVLIQSDTRIAKLFHNESVLENYHQSQFRKACVPLLEGCKLSLGEETIEYMDKLITRAILATDMAKHDDYVKELDHFDNKDDSWENKVMLGSLLIKSADISNVCRPLQTSVKWALSLGEEFKQVNQLSRVIQGEASCLDVDGCGFDIKTITADEAVKRVKGLSGSQMFFINRFASVFFKKVGENIGPIGFLYEQLEVNRRYWEAN